MSNLDLITGAASTAATVQAITSDSGNAAAAGGYAAFIQSIGGDQPYVQDLGDGRVRLPMTANDKALMTKWLDDAIKPSTQKAIVEYDFAAVITPWMLKYAIPASIGIFIAGYIAASLMQRKRK
jgi:hypothetical protein